MAVEEPKFETVQEAKFEVRQYAPQALAAWIQGRKLEPAGPVQLARCDPPWTLPLWGRNEIHIEIAAATQLP